MDVVYHSRCIHAPRWEGHMIKIQRKNILKSKYPPILQKKKRICHFGSPHNVLFNLLNTSLLLKKTDS